MFVERVLTAEIRQRIESGCEKRTRRLLGEWKKQIAEDGKRDPCRLSAFFVVFFPLVLLSASVDLLVAALFFQRVRVAHSDDGEKDDTSHKVS